MKRMLMRVLVLLLLVSTVVPAANAAGHGHRRAAAAVCTDNRQYAGACSLVDTDKDGVCDNCRTQCNRCENWTDENGDGICDHHTEHCQGTAQHSSPRRRENQVGSHCGKH